MDERVDMCGLDGYLTLEYGYTEDKDAIEARVMPRLAAHFGFKRWRESLSDFWAICMPNVQPSDKP